MEESVDPKPDWWNWELEISSHCQKRMRERGFDEIDLSAMLEDVVSIEPQDHQTYLVKTRHNDIDWEVIVVPKYKTLVIVVVTAYPAA
jgi:Domain of unknown function (DUF4258)